MPSYNPDQLLAQIPLTVSPFISLPAAPTLSYNYKSIPSTLPPSLLSSSGPSSAKPAYVTSRTGHAAHPDEIIASCAALDSSLADSLANATKTVHDWETEIRERELAEKRRVAPGWLDREEKLLRPEPSASVPTPERRDLLQDEKNEKAGPGERLDEVPAMRPRNEGVELDVAFGGLKLNPK